MKKLLTLVLLILITITVIGCTKKEELEIPIEGGWTTQLETTQQMLDEEIEKVFDTASKNYTKEKLERVALLATQVVAGKNYMFLAKTEKAYKVVVVYHDLEGNASIINVTDFNVTKYVSLDIKKSEETLTGGWKVEIPGKAMILEEKAQQVFDKVIENVKDTNYYPISTIATQIVAGTNYAVLCYGKENDKTGIYLLTIYNDLENNSELTSSAYINLSEYNK